MARRYIAASSQYNRSASTPVADNPMTLACWAYVLADGSYAIFGVGDTTQAANKWSYLLWRHTTNDRLSLMRADNGTDYIYSSANMFPINTWIHCCAVCRADDDAALFTNGADKIPDTTGKTPSGFNAITIGAQASTPSTYLQGMVADACLWSTALTDDEVWQLYKGRPPWEIQPAHLACHVPLRYGHTWDRDIRRGLIFTPYNSPTWRSSDPTQVIKYWQDYQIRRSRRLGYVPAAAPPPTGAAPMLALLGVGG